jgi:putative hydrolase of HD superfamily
MDSERMEQQVRFLLEVDKLKNVERRTYLLEGNRHENSAEHSWHLGVMALLMAEYANEPVDLGHVLGMLLVHDLVEIDAGDTFCYDAEGAKDRAEREQRAADRIFNLLPPDQASRLMELWREFEARESAEARFAAALDRLMPLFHNFYGKGSSWQEHGIRADQVRERNRHAREGSEFLWSHAESLITRAVEEGYLQPPR